MKRFLFTLLLLISLVLPALNANATASRWLTTLMGEQGAVGFLDNVIDSAVCDLDATIEDSYIGSGQTWANLIESPADGANQTDYDFHLGATSSVTTDDPTFTGSAGDSGAFFAVDGGDIFNIKTFANAINILKAHRTDYAGVWFVIAWRTPTTPAGTATFFGNSQAASQAGHRYIYLPDERIDLYVVDGIANKITGDLSDALVGDTEHLSIISWDGTATTNNIRFWLNSKTSVLRSATFGTNTTDAALTFNIAGTKNSSAQRLQADSRVYHFSCGNEFLDDTKAGLIFDHLEARHNRDYIP